MSQLRLRDREHRLQAAPRALARPYMAGGRRLAVLTLRRAHREEGSGEDAYELFAALHRTGRLLPDEDDRLRDALERNARIIDAAAGSIPSMLAEAFERRGRDIRAQFGGLVDVRLHVTAGGEEVWVAIATQAADERFVEERLRDVLFGLTLDAAKAVLWEPRADWPSGDPAWYEVARLGLRESPS